MFAPKRSLVSKYLLTLSAIAILATLLTVYHVRNQVHEQAKREAEAIATSISQRHLAIHQYYADQLKPNLFRDLAGTIDDPDYFNPSWMSSTYAIREIERYFQAQSSKHYRYKECAIDARTPQNEATPEEVKILRQMQDDPHKTKDFREVEIDGERFFIFYQRGETFDDSCLSCHGDPKEAPAQLVAFYGGDRSFHKESGKLASVLAITIPDPDDAPLTHTLLSTLLGMIGLILLGAYLTTRQWVISPLKVLQQHAERLHAHPDHLELKVPELAGIEMSLLGRTINRLTERLQDQHDNLEEAVKQRTEELDASRELLEAIFDTIPVGIALIDRSGHFLKLNKRYASAFGYSVAELLQGSVSLVRRDDASTLPKDIIRAFHAGMLPVQGEERRLTKSGRCIDVQTFRQIVHNPQGEELLLHAVIDQTEKKAKEEEFVTAMQMYESLFTEAPIGIVLIEAEGEQKGRIARLNSTFAQMHGYTVKEMQGMMIADLDTPEQAAQLPKRLKRLFNEKNISFHTRHFRKSGEIVELQARASLVEIDGKRYSLSSELDISAHNKMIKELKEATDEAKKANQAKSIFLSHMSHELRTPLNGLLGSLQLMHHDYLGTEMSELLQTAETCGDTLLTVINDLLDLSRIEAGQLKLTAAPFALEKMARSTLATFRPFVKERGVALRCHFAETLPPLLAGDEGRLRQVLFNLVGNATKFTQEGEIKVNFSSEPSPSNDERINLIMEVHDSGCGMPQEMLDRLGEPFLQRDEEQLHKSQGTGLGLAIVKRLVAAMEGTLEVSSRVDEGTSFTIRLPVTIAAPPGADETVEATPQPQPRDLRSLSVLLVEDNAMNLLVGRRMLEKFGVTPDTAGNGHEALAALKQKKYDLTLMDIQMPEMDGLETINRIRRGEEGILAPRARIIALSAFTLPNEKERIMSAGFDGYLEKPLDMKKLEKTLQETKE